MGYSFERIKILITSECNSNCKHCFRSKEKNSEFITFEKLKEIIDFGVNNNCHHFGFSGGEFFMHPQCYDLINYCLTKQVKIKILTNALKIDEEFFNGIKNKDLIAFQVSVDGLEKAHDQRRGEGSFGITIKNVKKLYALGYSISAKMVLDVNNYIDVPAILDMPWFKSVLILPMAIDKNMTVDINDSKYQEYEKTVQIIYKSMIMSNRQPSACLGYPHELAIKYNGNVYPCTEAREHDEFLIGNINNQTLESLLQQYENNKSNKLKCKDLIINECINCKHKDVCNTGCRLRALRFNGDFFSPDPFLCRIFDDKYYNIPIGKLIWGIKD